MAAEGSRATITMEQDLTSAMSMKTDGLGKTYEEEEEENGSDIEAVPPTPHIAANTNGATSETQTKDEKWKYITCGLTLFGLSIPFFGLYFSHWHSLTNLLAVMICLLVFTTVFGVLSYIVYQKISEEERLKLEGNPDNHKIAICSVQLCLFFLFVFLTATVYVLVAVNAICKYNGAHKP